MRGFRLTLLRLVEFGHSGLRGSGFWAWGGFGLEKGVDV